MGLAVGNTDSVIHLDITEPDDNGVEQPTTFIPGTDTVNFAMKSSDGTVLVKAGIFLTGSRAKYTTVTGDLPVAGRMEIQLQINGSPWIGSSDPPFVTEVGEKFLAT